VTATELGIDIIQNIPAELCDPGITAAWEDALSHIASNEYDPEQFMLRVDQMIDKRISQTSTLKASGKLIKAKPPERPAGKSSGKPKAKKASPTAAKKSAAPAPPRPNLPDLKGFF
jgi:DNA topoisomerase-3